jgi:hypothetical protein
LACLYFDFVKHVSAIGGGLSSGLLRRVIRPGQTIDLPEKVQCSRGGRQLPGRGSAAIHPPPPGAGPARRHGHRF